MSTVKEDRESVGVARKGESCPPVTCESALRETGVDETLIAKKLKEQLEAKQPRWNPKKKAFDLFPDHDAQLAALREVVKIFGGYPSESESGEGTVMIDLGRLTPKKFRDDGRERSER